jgi:hypothetical protein
MISYCRKSCVHARVMSKRYAPNVSSNTFTFMPRPPHLMISHGSLPFCSRRLYILAGVVLGDPRAVEPSLAAVVEVEAHRYERRGGGFGCVRLLSFFVARPSLSTIRPHLSFFLASSFFVRAEIAEQRLRGFVTEASESNTSSKQASFAFLCSTGLPSLFVRSSCM